MSPPVTPCHPLSPPVTRCHPLSRGVTLCHPVSPSGGGAGTEPNHVKERRECGRRGRCRKGFARGTGRVPGRIPLPVTPGLTRGALVWGATFDWASQDRRDRQPVCAWLASRGKAVKPGVCFVAEETVFLLPTTFRSFGERFPGPKSLR